MSNIIPVFSNPIYTRVDLLKQQSFSRKGGIFGNSKDNLASRI